jgi:hypothetical protein
MSVYYHVLLGGTLLVGLLAIGIAFVRSHDPFHPLVIACPIALFFYFYMPVLLEREGQLTWYVTPEGLELAQGVFLTLLSAFCLGALAGAGDRALASRQPHPSAGAGGGRALVPGGLLDRDGRARGFGRC